MKTRYSQLVLIKKRAMQKSEQALQEANINLQTAKDALQNSYNSLDQIEQPMSGSISLLLASKTLFNSKHAEISHNQEWVEYAQNQVNMAKEQLKKDTIEYEKFNYLELEEIKKIVKEQKIQEAKDLDEVALMTFKKRKY
jgi:flagellar biosynthesis chaperone FliJ